MTSPLTDDPEFVRLLPLLALIAAGSLAAGSLLTIAFIRGSRRRTMRLRQKRGTRGEVDAAHFLKKQGYTHIAEQCPGFMTMHVDGVSEDIHVRADFVAHFRNCKCVVEVKTGEKAPDPLFTDTRRQLLEYAAAYGVHEVHLYDAEAHKMHRVVFPALQRTKHSWRFFIPGIMAGMLIGVVLAVVLVYILYIFGWEDSIVTYSIVLSLHITYRACST